MRKSPQARAGIIFPVRRVQKYLKSANPGGRVMINTKAAIFLAATLEYIVAEVVELSGTAAQQNKKHLIQPCHLTLAVFNDNELSKLFLSAKVILPSGGVVPFIQPALLKPPPTRKPPASVKTSSSGASASRVKGGNRNTAVKKPIARPHGRTVKGGKGSRAKKPKGKENESLLV